MARVESKTSLVGYNPESSIANFSGLSRLEVGKKLAEQKGMICPSAGLPDEPAIEAVLGFSGQDIYRNKKKNLLQGSCKRYN